MDAIECMKTRRSIRSYQDKSVPEEVIEDIIDCGRLAASARGVQPWYFVAVRDPDMRKKIADISDHGKFIAQSPVCVAVFCHDTKYYLEDGCAATQNILNAARAHGLGSCWVAGDKKEYGPKIGEMLGMPGDCKLIALVSIGYPAEERSPQKKALSEVMSWEHFSG